MARHPNTPPPEYLPPRSESKSNYWIAESAVYPVPPAVSVVRRPIVKPKHLDHWNQIWSLLLPQAVRWLATVVLSAAIVLVLWIYNVKGNFTRDDKNAFNILVTGLSVGLGINFFVRLPILA